MNDDPVRIELARPEDASALLDIHAAAVHQTAASYYTSDIIHSWSPLPITCARIERIKQQWIENPDHRVAVAKQDSRIIGFGFIHKNNRLQALYVHPRFGRQGVGAKILAFLEQEALMLGLSHLTVDASVNAEAFYKKQGFEVLEHGTYRLNSGRYMACVKMRKILTM